MDKLQRDKSSVLTVAYNLSGALEAVKLGRFIVLVDVIDMSTTMEGILEAGAVSLWGAAPVGRGLPYADPLRIGQAAAQEAQEKGAEIVVIAEPRVGSQAERQTRAGAVLAGLKKEGIEPLAIWPNLGAETAKFADWRDKIAIVVSDAGGTIYDAVWQMGGRISTATVARTMQKKGSEVVKSGVERALAMAEGTPLTLVAASSNALEDVLAVQYLAQYILARL